MQIFLKKSKKGITSIYDMEGNILINGDDVANVLNNSFSSVFVNEDTKNIPYIVPKTNSTLLIDINDITSRNTIEKKLKNLS